MSDPHLKVLTLNCWGLWLVANKRRERLQAIAEWIANSSSSTTSRNSYHSDDSSQTSTEGYDVIALQEIWVRSDFELVAERAKLAGLNYAKFFYSGAIGSGLAIISRYPILSSWICPYPLNGFPLHFIQGDFFAGKSICGICIDVPNGVGLVEVLNTHMYAPGGEGDDVTGAHRIAQAWELAKFVREKAERGRHVIVTGDFNSQPHSIIMKLIQSLGGLYDSFSETHPPPPSITSQQHRSLSPIESMHVHGITCDSPLNTYSAAKLRNKSPRDDVILRGGKRLDYLLYRSPPAPSMGSLKGDTIERGVLKAETTRLKLTEPIPNLDVSYSDHCALEATFSLSSSTPSTTDHPSREDATQLLSPALSTLHAAYRHNQSNSRFQLELFLGSILLIPILCITASFQPLKYLNWIWTLLGIVDGVVGSTMLYTGFVGGRWEAGALRNVVGEIEDELERTRRRSSTESSSTSTRTRGRNGEIGNVDTREGEEDSPWS